MVASPQSTRRKLSLLHLAQELQNVSKGIMGYHRDSFYELRRAFQVGGVHPQRPLDHRPHPLQKALTDSEIDMDERSPRRLLADCGPETAKQTKGRRVS